MWSQKIFTNLEKNGEELEIEGRNLRGMIVWAWNGSGWEGEEDIVGDFSPGLRNKPGLKVHASALF
jgi:hypothetical protein